MMTLRKHRYYFTRLPKGQEGGIFFQTFNIISSYRFMQWFRFSTGSKILPLRGTFTSPLEQ